MHQNLEVDFLGKMANFDSLGRKTIVLTREKSEKYLCLLARLWSFGQGHFGHFQLGNAVICSLYI